MQWLHNLALQQIKTIDKHNCQKRAFSWGLTQSAAQNRRYGNDLIFTTYVILYLYESETV